MAKGRTDEWFLWFWSCGFSKFIKKGFYDRICLIEKTFSRSYLKHLLRVIPARNFLFYFFGHYLAPKALNLQAVMLFFIHTARMSCLSRICPVQTICSCIVCIGVSTPPQKHHPLLLRRTPLLKSANCPSPSPFLSNSPVYVVFSQSPLPPSTPPLSWKSDFSVTLHDIKIFYS